MAMPKSITLINKHSEVETVLGFQHAERLLRLELKNGTNSFSVKGGKYIFNGNDIIRRTSDKDSQGETK
jgi:hypothetical protein